MLLTNAFLNLPSILYAKEMLNSITPLLLIIFIFYFLVIRPQHTKVKEHYNMIQGLKKNDRIIVSGIIGTISKIEPKIETVTIKIAPNTEVQITKNAVSQLLNK